MKRPIAGIFLALLFFAASPAAVARDLDYERLADRLDQLQSDPRLGNLAPTQMERARNALQMLKDAGRRDRPQMIYIAERRIDIARTSAEAEAMETQRVALQRENDRLQLEAARRDAEQARRELEQQRLQAQIRAEEADRLASEAATARAEGEQANQAAEAARAEAAQSKRMADAQAKAAALAKKEAELAAAVGGSPSGGSASAAPARRVTLADSAFASGAAGLTSAGTSRIAKAVDLANGAPGASVHVEATVPGNRALARQRADAIRDALIEGGVAASRIEVTGSAGARGAKSRAEIRVDGGF